MKMSTTCFFLLGMLPAIAHGQPSMRWEDLSEAVARAAKADHSVEFVVVTNAGPKLTSRSLSVSPTEVNAGGGKPAVPRDQVVEVRASHKGRLYYYSTVMASDAVTHAVFLVSIYSAFVLTIPVVGGIVVYAVASSPPMLAVEGIRRIGSTKVLYRAP